MEIYSVVRTVHSTIVPNGCSRPQRDKNMKILMSFTSIEKARDYIRNYSIEKEKFCILPEPKLLSYDASYDDNRGNGFRTMHALEEYDWWPFNGTRTDAGCIIDKTINICIEKSELE